MNAIPRSSLREYDISRPAMLIRSGLAFATIIAEDGGRTVCVGFDGRLSSPELSDALIRGLAEGGCDVVTIGCGPTPMLYFASHLLAADGAIMVTGSHNPPSHNGFKMVRANKPFFGQDIQRLGAVAAGNPPAATPAGDRLGERGGFRLRKAAVVRFPARPALDRGLGSGQWRPPAKWSSV